MNVQTWWNPAYPRPEYIPPGKKGQRFGKRRRSADTMEKVYYAVKRCENQTSKEIARITGLADQSVRPFLYSLRNDGRVVSALTAGKPTLWSVK